MRQLQLIEEIPAQAVPKVNLREAAQFGVNISKLKSNYLPRLIQTSSNSQLQRIHLS